MTCIWFQISTIPPVITPPMRSGGHTGKFYINNPPLFASLKDTTLIAWHSEHRGPIVDGSYFWESGQLLLRFFLLKPSPMFLGNL